MFPRFREVAWSRQFAAEEKSAGVEEWFLVSICEPTSLPLLACPFLDLIIFCCFQWKSGFLTAGQAPGLCLKRFPEGPTLILPCGHPARCSAALRPEALGALKGQIKCGEMVSLSDTFPHVEDEKPWSLREPVFPHNEQAIAKNKRPDIILPFRDPISGRFGSDTHDDAEK